MRRQCWHTWASFRSYGWREWSTIGGAVLVLLAVLVIFVFDQATLAEYRGRMGEVAAMIPYAMAVLGLYGMIRRTGSPPPTDGDQ